MNHLDITITGSATIPRPARPARPDVLLTILEATRFRPSGFDYMRIVLASSVVFFHLALINYGAAAQHALWESPWRAPIGLILPAFFALSGFLVAGSLERSRTIVGFLALRGIRIFPALLVEVFISALVLGPIVTSVSLSQYFSGHAFFTYFLNISGWIHYQLPGVFLENPFPKIINGQLWTVPFELDCYLSLAMLFFLRIYQNRAIFLLVVALWQIVYILSHLIWPEVEVGIPGPSLVITFLAGVVVYLYRERIVMRGDLALLAAAFCLGSFFTPLGAHSLAFPVAYLTVYVGTRNPPKAWILGTGDYSYGIFLYSFPIQQGVSWLGSWTHHWIISLAISLPIVVIVAFLSWHGIEKHALLLRKRVPKLEAFFGERFGGVPAVWWLTKGVLHG
jgi:peptidoglycan/LPS O-acetylase OafA/YrhL